MDYKKIEQEYGVIFGRKKDSKDLRDPQHFKELYMSKISSEEDGNEIIRKLEEFEEQGYETAVAKINIYGKLEPDESLEVKITKSGLKPSPKGTLGCDFDI
ncbi:MAG: hypothetical protein Q8O03_02680 [Nanoarchaeota archaeon]|nr:hypothetical protein [Nanoarchaeota archaeon]